MRFGIRSHVQNLFTARTMDLSKRDDFDDSQLSLGATAGVIVGSVFGFLFILAFAMVMWRRNRKPTKHLETGSTAKIKDPVTERPELEGQPIAELCAQQEPEGVIHELETPELPAEYATGMGAEAFNPAQESQHRAPVAARSSSEGRHGEQEYPGTVALPPPDRPSVDLRRPNNLSAQELRSLKDDYAQLEARRQRILEIESIERKQAELRERMGMT